MAARDGKTARAGWCWSCASKYCKNAWKTPNVEYYTLTKVGSAPKTVQDAYLEVLGKRKEDVNFKNQVICSKHWSCGKRPNLDDFPSIKFTESGSQVSPKVKQEHLHCATMLCTNSWRTKNKNLKYYRLKEFADCPEKWREYNKILKNKGINFKRDFICSAHWSKGERKNLIDLPDLPCAPEFAERKVTNKTTPVSKIKCAK